jgi:hypothetical protein
VFASFADQSAHFPACTADDLFGVGGSLLGIHFLYRLDDLLMRVPDSLTASPGELVEFFSLAFLEAERLFTPSGQDLDEHLAHGIAYSPYDPFGIDIARSARSSRRRRSSGRFGPSRSARSSLLGHSLVEFAGGVDTVGYSFEHLQRSGRCDYNNCVGVLVQCYRKLCQGFLEAAILRELTDHMDKRFSRYVLEAEDPQFWFLTITLVAIPVAIALLALSVFAFFTLLAFFAFTRFVSPTFVPGPPLALFASPFLPLSIAAAPVGHAATFGPSIMSLAVTITLTFGPCSSRQDQNYPHSYPSCSRPSHDIVLSIGGILYVGSILPDCVSPFQTFPSPVFVGRV